MSKGSKKKPTPRKEQQQQGFPPAIPDVAAQYFSQLAHKAKHNKRETPTPLSFGSLDLAALAQSGDLSAATAAASSQKPCSEQEVKALMSMFAEIMGMEEPPATASNSKMPVFMFGNKGWRNSVSTSMTSHFAAAMNSGMMANGLDDDNDDDDDTDDELYQKQPAAPIAISPEDWNELEQVVTEEQLAEEDRHRKAMKRREKKHRKKDRVRQERDEKAVAAAEKKHSAKLQSWKSRLVSAAQANDVTKLDALLGESPLGDQDEIQTCMEFLWPTCMAKSRDLENENREARLVLADYVLLHQPDVVHSVTKLGLNSLHWSSLTGDYPLLRLVIERLKKHDSPKLTNLLDQLCDDSGWAPLHYAVISASGECMEALLAAGANTQTRTDVSKAMYKHIGLTPRELAQTIMGGKLSDTESFNLAIDDLQGLSLCGGRNRRQYYDQLNEVMERLAYVEAAGYNPPSSGPFAQEEEVHEIEETSPSKCDSSKKKRKKKKKQQQEEATIATVQPNHAPVEQDDPMIPALLGMGFTREQIMEAVNSLGGINKATADDVVVWIFGLNEGEIDRASEPQPNTSKNQAGQALKEVTSADQELSAAAQARRNELEASKKVEEELAAARRLAVKREEQRQRNREWNNRQRDEVQAKLAHSMKLKVNNESQQIDPRHLGGLMPPIHAPAPPRIPTQLAATPIGINQNGMNSRVQYTLVGGVPGMLPDAMAGRNATVHGNPGGHRGGVNQYLMPPAHGAEMPTSEFPGFVRDGHYEEDSVTVSSFGSRRTGSIQGDPFPVQPLYDSYQERPHVAPVPPGFGKPTPSFEDAGARTLYDSNHTGEIRATARAFVPTTTLKMAPPISTSGLRGNTPAMLDGNSLGGYATPNDGNIVHSASILGSANMSGFDVIPSLLSSVSLGNNNRPTGLFNRAPATPYSPVPSATSSVTGVSVHDDPPPTGFAIDLAKRTAGSSTTYMMPPMSSHISVGGLVDNAIAPTTGLTLWGTSMPTAPAPSGPTALGTLLNFSGDISDRKEQNGASVGPLNPGWNAGGPPYSNGGANSNGLGSIW